MEKYLQLMQLFDPSLALDIFMSLAYLFEYYAYGVFLLFTHKADVGIFLEDLRQALVSSIDTSVIFEKYRNYLTQRLALDFRRSVLKIQDHMIEHNNFGHA